MTRRRAIRFAVLVSVIVLLELICRLGWVRPTDLLASIAIAAVLGVVAGVVLHAMPNVRRACEPFIASYYALPLFALYPMLVVILGVGTAPIVFTGTLYAAMSVLLGT